MRVDSELLTENDQSIAARSNRKLKHVVRNSRDESSVGNVKPICER